jgi:hypothetical protein
MPGPKPGSFSTQPKTVLGADAPTVHLATCAAANYQDQQLGQQQQPLWVFLQCLYSSDYRRYSSESAAAKFYVHSENLSSEFKILYKKIPCGAKGDFRILANGITRTSEYFRVN